MDNRAKKNDLIERLTALAEYHRGMAARPFDVSGGDRVQAARARDHIATADTITEAIIYVRRCPMCGEEQQADCDGTGWLDAIGPCRDGSYITSRPCRGRR